MNYSWALNELKAGKTITRKGWNGKDMFIYYVPPSKFTVNRPPLTRIYEKGTKVSYLGHIDMRNADGDHVPWTANQADQLADDWEHC